jgi:hypothetical protein
MSTLNAITSGAGGVALSGDTSGNLIIQSAGTNTAVFTTGGNLGIGTTTPASKLDVFTDTVTFGDTGSFNFAINGTNIIFKNGTGGTTERMRITSAGTVAINGSSTAYSFSVIGTSGKDIGLFQVATNGDIISFQNASGVRQGYIQILSGSVSYTSTSDYRLKENIAPMTGALDKVTLLKPVTYKFKADGSSNQGFIAHELQTVIPEAVSGEKDAIDAEGNPLYQAIDQAKIVATLTAAIQELNAKVDAQALEIAALKGA